MDKALAQKLLSFQKKVTSIKKDLENPYFKSSYFDINAVVEAIRPILNDVGLIVLQPLVTVFNDLKPHSGIKTIIIDSETGAEISETTPITELPKAQEMGSAITYFRRYALVSMLLLQGENDDDGNVASNAKPKYTPPAGATMEKRKVIPQPINKEGLPF